MEMNVHSLGNDFADGHAGVQGSVWILEDDLDILAELQQILALEGGDVLAVEYDLAGGWLIQLHHGSAAGGLAAAGLAYQAQGLAAFDRYSDVIDRFEHLLFACLKEFAQVGDLHDGVSVLQFFNYLIHYFASLS